MQNDGEHVVANNSSVNRSAALPKMSTAHEEERRIVKALKMSGLMDWIGIVGAFRGVQNERFPGTVLGKIYRGFEVFSDASSVCNIVSLSFMFVWAERSDSRWMCAFPLLNCFLCIYMSQFPGFRKAKFRSVFISFDSVFKGHPNAIHLAAEIEKGAKTTRIITNLLILLQFLPMVSLCVLLPLLNEALNHAIMPRKLNVPSLFPFDPLATLPNYLSAIFLQLCGCVFVNLKIIGFMETFFIFGSRLIAMFKILRLNLHELLKQLDGALNLDRSPAGLHDRRVLSKAVVRSLQDWVENHQKCLRILKEIENLFSWPFAVYYGMLILIICSTALVVTDKSMDTMTVVFSGTYVLGAILQLLAITRMGDTITNEVDELTAAILGTNFYLLNSEEYKLLRIILTRCQKICVIKVLGMFPISVETFKSIITSSYSYFTVLKKSNESLDE